MPRLGQRTFEQCAGFLRIPNGKPGDKGAAALLDYLARPAEDTVLLISLPKLDGSTQKTKWAKALIDGRLAPSVDDVVSLAEPVLKHRMALSFAARTEGQEIGGVIARLAERLA